MTKRALCIGINDYPGTHMDLSGCINDAHDWAAALANRGFKTTKLLNRKATRAGIRDAIGDLMAASKPDDSLAIMFSGHGSFVPDKNGDEPDGTDECICPHDVDKKGAISDDELYDLYNGRDPESRLVIFSDSCHSGSVAKFVDIKTPPAVKGGHSPRGLVKFMPPQTFLSKKAAAPLGLPRVIRKSSSPGRHAGLLMAGCQDVEYSYDAYFNGRPNGAFTFVALSTLTKLGKTATYDQWYRAIRKVLPSQQYAQTPNLFGSSVMRKWQVLQ